MYTYCWLGVLSLALTYPCRKALIIQIVLPKHIPYPSSYILPYTAKHHHRPNLRRTHLVNNLQAKLLLRLGLEICSPDNEEA